jgi:hypothetical protein
MREIFILKYADGNLERGKKELFIARLCDYDEIISALLLYGPLACGRDYDDRPNHQQQQRKRKIEEEKSFYFLTTALYAVVRR